MERVCELLTVSRVAVISKLFVSSSVSLRERTGKRAKSLGVSSDPKYPHPCLLVEGRVHLITRFAAHPHGGLACVEGKHGATERSLGLTPERQSLWYAYGHALVVYDASKRPDSLVRR